MRRSSLEVFSHRGSRCRGHNRRAHFRAAPSPQSKNRRLAAARQLVVVLNPLTVDPATLTLSASSPTVLVRTPLAALSNTFRGSATFRQVA